MVLGLRGWGQGLTIFTGQIGTTPSKIRFISSNQASKVIACSVIQEVCGQYSLLLSELPPEFIIMFSGIPVHSRGVENFGKLSPAPVLGRPLDTRPGSGRGENRQTLH